MRDIVQASFTIYNPYTGVVSGGSEIEPISPDYLSDGLLDENGYIFNDSELWIGSELWEGY